MPRALQPATRADVQRVRLALAQLREARDNLRAAGAVLALARVNAALKSADGALRHVERRAHRTADGMATIGHNRTWEA